MAEAFLNLFGEGKFEAESAGLEKGTLSPHALQVMQEIGIDLSRNEPKEIFELFRQGRHYNAVISLCDQTNGEKSPLYPGMTQRISWSFSDLSRFTGTEEEILEKIRAVRDGIKEKVLEFIEQASDTTFWLTEQLRN